MARLARTPYERAVLRDARASFDNPFRTPLAVLAHLAEQRTPPAHGRTREGEGERDELVVAAVTAASGGIVALANATARTLRPDAIVRSYRREGHRAVRAIDDLQNLALWEVDEVADRLKPKYLLLAAAGAAFAPQLGVAALPVGVPFVVACALRAIQDYAMHYGFDLATEDERAYAIQILLAAMIPGVAVEDATFADLSRVAEMATRAWKRHVRSSWMLPFGLQLLRRLLRRRAGGRTLRRVASVVAAAANAWFLAGVAEIAQAAYRGRFLARARERRLDARETSPDVAPVVALRRKA